MRSILAASHDAQPQQSRRYLRLALALIASIAFVAVVAVVAFAGVGGFNLIHTALAPSLHWFTAGPCSGLPAPC